MTSRTTAGSRLYISAATPATFDAAGYAALAWTEIGEITDLGEFGRVFNLVTHNPVATRATVKKKGSYNDGQMTLQLAIDNADAGQIMARTALNSDNNYSFRLVDQGGTRYGMQCQVMSFPISPGGVDTIFAGSIQLEVTTGPNGEGIIQY